MNRLLFGQARKDPPTKLGNRLQMHEDLELMRGRMKRYGHSYSVSWTGAKLGSPYQGSGSLLPFAVFTTEPPEYS